MYSLRDFLASHRLSSNKGYKGILILDPHMFATGELFDKYPQFAASLLLYVFYPGSELKCSAELVRTHPTMYG